MKNIPRMACNAINEHVSSSEREMKKNKVNENKILNNLDDIIHNAVGEKNEHKHPIGIFAC